MSFEDEMKTGFAEALSFAGESFTMGNHAGDFRGVFRGDDAPTAFDQIQGYETKTTNAMSTMMTSGPMNLIRYGKRIRSILNVTL